MSVYPKTSACWPLLAVAVFIFAARANAADDLETSAKFNIWSVVCSKTTPKPTCSIVAAVHSDKEPESWAKVGLSLSETTSEIEMILRTPRLTFLKSGISLGFDGKQYARAFVERCEISSCETTVVVDTQLRNLIGTREKMTLEYPVSENEGVVLAFDLDGIVPALNYLRDKTGPLSAAVASIEGWRLTANSSDEPTLKFSVELRSWPNKSSDRSTTRSWDTPLKGCGKTPAVKEIRVSKDMSIINFKELNTWLEGSKKCGESSLVWVVPTNSSSNPEGQFALDRKILGLYAVYGSVKELMPQVVISTDDKTRVPIDASAGNVILTYGMMPSR